MSKLYSILVSLILTISIFAQAPQQFSYQAVVRGVNNELAVNKQIGMRISLLQGSNTGNAVYIETHTPLSNANGLVSISIGNGTVVSGTFANIDWSKGPYFVKTETDVVGGINYTLQTTNQLLSVPYALFSANDKDDQKLTVSSTGDTLYLQNGGYVIIPGISTANPKPKPTSGYGPNITDINGNTYKTVYIGAQQWMAENLKVSKYNDGTTIPNISDLVTWRNLTSGAWCYHNNDASKNVVYGKLYNWYAISKTTNNNKNVCPTGWHVPTDAEWTVLIDYLGVGVAGSKMKEVGSLHWLSPNTSATNSSLFTALPGGFRDAWSGNDSNIGTQSWWWSSSEMDTYSVYCRFIFNTSVVVPKSNKNKNYGYSVRCIKD